MRKLIFFMAILIFVSQSIYAQSGSRNNFVVGFGSADAGSLFVNLGAIMTKDTTTTLIDSIFIIMSDSGYAKLATILLALSDSISYYGIYYDSLNIGNGDFVKMKDGKVGIGTASPQNILDIGNNTYGNLAIRLNAAATSQRAIEWLDAGVSNWQILKAASSSDLRFYHGGVRVKLMSDGDVVMGIDTTFYFEAGNDIIYISKTDSIASFDDIAATKSLGVAGDLEVLGTAYYRAANWSTADLAENFLFNAKEMQTVKIPQSKFVGIDKRFVNKKSIKIKKDGKDFDGEIKVRQAQNIKFPVLELIPEPVKIDSFYTDSTFSYLDSIIFEADTSVVYFDIKDSVKVINYVYDDFADDIIELEFEFLQANPGDVVIIDPDYDKTVKLSNKIGIKGWVISTDPAIVMSGKLENGVTCALKGKVPCKVDAFAGAIKRGDALTTGLDGKAVLWKSGEYILGYALEECLEGEKVITISVE